MIGIEDTAALFARALDCAEDPDIQLLPDPDPTDGSKITLHTWSRCPSGGDRERAFYSHYRVALYEMRNAGHVWPGGEHVLPRLTGPMNRDFDASNVIWLFFDNVWR
ncbi:MAG TPA: hypothetical protein QF665_03265 [Alphaproteobacteria bacterium]|nr:hypothetical protein [Alphaproteobacteria bacterium]